MPHVWLRISILGTLLTLAGCGDFKQYKVLRSPEGVYATIAIPSTKDAFTVCLADHPLKTCSRSEAVFYSYRSLSGDEWWSEPNVLMIRQEGGEVRKGLPDGPVNVGGRQVFVRLEYRPATS